MSATTTTAGVGAGIALVTLACYATPECDMERLRRTMLIVAIKRLGLVQITLIFTAISIVMSVLITYCLAFIFGGMPGRGGLTTAIITPAIIAPIFNVIVVRLILELDRSREALHYASITDAMTGAYNRGYILQRAEQLFTGRKAAQDVCSIILLDVDHFKQLNDTWGHQAGDYVLQTLSAQCISINSDRVLFGRYGGEEFLFLLDQMPLHEACAFAERIRALIAATPILYQDRPLQITISIGVAALRWNDHDLDDLLYRADQALYFAKQAGKNRVHCAEVLAAVA